MITTEGEQPMINDQTIQLTIPADYKHLNVVGACVTAILQHEDIVENREIITSGVELAIHEICINIIEHAYGDIFGQIMIRISVHKNPSRLEIKINDQGNSFILQKILPPKMDDDIQIRGYGLFLVHELMDEVRYIPELGNNTWHLVKVL